MELSIDNSVIDNAVREEVKKLGLVPRDDKRAQKISLDDFRENYCLNHSKTWVRNIIFDRFPETWDQNGGWVINPSGKEPGIRGTWIKIDQATKWLEEHDDAIDWHEQLA